MKCFLFRALIVGVVCGGVLVTMPIGRVAADDAEQAARYKPTALCCPPWERPT